MKKTTNALLRPAVEADQAGDRRTRDLVVSLLLEHGPLTAAGLAQRVGLTAAGIRRHLDALELQGQVAASEQPAHSKRGRGRPAKTFTLTEAGRAGFRHTYDSLAVEALRYLAHTGGPAAVTAFATHQVSALEERCRLALENAGSDPLARAEALANVLSQEGYAANASVIAGSGQLCQHHCPVGQVAAEFPQLCEAETAAIARLVGSHVQRLATIAHGDGVCTTHIPGLSSTPPSTMTTMERNPA